MSGPQSIFKNHGWSSTEKETATIVVFFYVNSVKLLPQIGAVIITPTRELATQIDEVLSHFLRHLDDRFTHMLFIGGTNPVGDVDRFLQHGFGHSS